VLYALAAVFATSPVRSETIVVSAAPFVVSSGILALGGQAYHVTATGTVEIAGFDGPYETDADGQIAVAPPEGSGAYNFFFGQLPVGPPTVGSFKNIDPDYDPDSAAVLGAPFGALSAGFSTTLTPTSYTMDFPEGFAVVGTDGIITAPSGGGYLMFSVNDNANRSDNFGSFAVNFTAVPEPVSFLLAAVGLFTVAFDRGRRARLKSQLH